jgi:glucose-1-phosphate adenylyltransferase
MYLPPDARTSTVLGLILAGGEGKRLHPLTRDRAKPAVPFGGRYRLIDFVLSNFINSGILKVHVLTQYKAGSLMNHLARGWQLAPHFGAYVAPVPASMNDGPRWFAGSADAVFQNLPLVLDPQPKHVCVFGADHIYKMDIGQMLAFHVERGAAATVAVVPVPAGEADQYGVVRVDDDGRVVDFREKPHGDAAARGPALASTGLYVFRTEVLVDAVTRDAERPGSAHDFGRDILPALATGGHLYAYDFTTNAVPGMEEAERGYWRDVGTLDAYWRASMDLVAVSPVFSLYNREWPIHSAYAPNPPAKFVFADGRHDRTGIATDSMVCEGCVISGGRVDRSILGPRVRVHSFAHVSESVLFDDVEIGRHAAVRRAIIDKRVVVPPGMRIGVDLEADRRRFRVTDDGIVVVPRGACLAS